jgi:predicted nucleotidyltransferase
VRPSTVASLPIFRSELQARLLALVLPSPERRWTAAELQERLDAVQQTLSNELRRLAAAGLLEVETVGRTKLYRAATASPLYEPLRELVERTLGVEELLRAKLGEIEGVEVAAIFGSWAAGTPTRPASDIDLLVVGRVDFERVADALRQVEEVAGREIHLVLYARDELRDKLAAGSGFVSNVLRGELKPLIGDPSQLLRLTAA